MYNELLKTIKQAAVEAVNSSKPAGVYYGTVISKTPLKIRLSQTIILTKEHLKLTKAVMDYNTNITLPSGTVSATVKNGLQVGDKVIMLRMQGGQGYLVIDKEVE